MGKLVIRAIGPGGRWAPRRSRRVCEAYERRVAQNGFRLSAISTVRELLAEVESELTAANVFFGHGTDNAASEALALVLGVLGWPFEVSDARLDSPVERNAEKRVKALARRRIEDRIPLAYLLNKAWFAGHEFYVDERVLIPRSPFAELIEARFSPWMISEPHQILEVGTGSGCIAMALALAFDNASVVATDISPAALEVAMVNRDRLALEDRVELLKADVFPDDERRFDLIVSNPPYVPRARLSELPAEYSSEPECGLVAGDDGLSIVERLLDGAHSRLTKHGLLAVEVGESATRLQEAYPNSTFTWLEFEFGGEGVFLATHEELIAAMSPSP
ncbi:MAG: 50S ribosomal protein L3 N(5)-glutamine methyltransferase [Pseudomonadota bacterium]